MDKITDKRPKVAVLLAFLLVGILLSKPIAVADMGPKPQATFDVVGTENLGNFHIILFYDNDSPGFPHCGFSAHFSTADLITSTISCSGRLSAGP